MKFPACLCGALRGFHHDLKCISCGCWPWQHSSDESEYSSEESEDEEQEKIRRRVQDELEEKRMEQIDQVERAIQAGKFCIEYDEDRFLMHHRILDAERPKKIKKLRKRGQRNTIRTVVPTFEEKTYKLDVYGYYKAKNEYKINELCSYFYDLGLEPLYTAKRFEDANLDLFDLNLRSYEDFLQEK